MDNIEGGGVKCGRWNPTKEQVKVLMDLFRAGLRTPTADQIQRISSHLSAYGKIESKNVFYWFQNHKARERHHVIKKRRRGSPGGAGGDLTRTVDHCNIVINPARKEARHDDAPVAWEYLEGRDVETLELFPLKSHCNYESPEDRTTSEFSWNDEGQVCIQSHDNDGLDLQLDLRLSFLHYD